MQIGLVLRALGKDNNFQIDLLQATNNLWFAYYLGFRVFSSIFDNNYVHGLVVSLGENV